MPRSPLTHILVVSIAVLIVLTAGLIILAIRQNQFALFTSSQTNLSTIDHPQLTELLSQTAIHPRELAYTTQERTRPSVVVLDLRPGYEYEVGHLKNALSLPYSVILQGSFTLPANDIQTILYTGKNQPIDENQIETIFSQKGVPQVQLISAPYEDWADQYEQETSTDEDNEDAVDTES